MHPIVRKQPLVSVITPTFNRAKLLLEAVNSVLQQTYPFWELIIWDDGSTDETQTVLQRLQDPRIQFYQGTNHGQAFARNQGLTRSKGNYIAFLDDDDRWWPHKLGRQVEIMERHREIDILFANFENQDDMQGRATFSFEANQDVLGCLKTQALEPKVKLIVAGFPENYMKRNFVLPSSTIMRKGVYDVAGPFNEQLRGTEDKEYWWRCTLRGARFAYDEEVLLIRRKGEDSFTAGGERSLVENIKALHHCLDATGQIGRGELRPVVKRAIGTAWENMIRFYWRQGRKKKSLEAFKRRCHYGFSLRAVALMVGSMFGPGALRFLRGAPSTSTATSQSTGHAVANASEPLPAGTFERAGKRKEL